MYKHSMKKVNHWLLPAVLILFVLQVVMLPWAIDYTWADRSDSPTHVLTYTENKLTWDSATDIRADGTAELKLFDSAYDSAVTAGNGDKIIAPGTGNSMYVRLKNSVWGTVSYTAVLYNIKTDERIPAEADLYGTGFSDTVDYSLPDGVTEAQVVRAVKGTIDGGQIQDFDMSWMWDYEENSAQDDIDTLLGDMTELPEVSAGLYIVVEDNNTYVNPDSPKTGDSSPIGLYSCLMAVSFVLLILLLWDRRREAGRENN